MPLWHCVHCQAQFKAWKACERHADSTPGHYRFASDFVGHWPTPKAESELHPTSQTSTPSSGG